METIQIIMVRLFAIFLFPFVLVLNVVFAIASTLHWITQTVVYGEMDDEFKNI